MIWYKNKDHNWPLILLHHMSQLLQNTLTHIDLQTHASGNNIHWSKHAVEIATSSLAVNMQHNLPYHFKIHPTFNK